MCFRETFCPFAEIVQSRLFTSICFYNTLLPYTRFRVEKKKSHSLLILQFKDIFLSFLSKFIVTFEFVRNKLQQHKKLVS